MTAELLSRTSSPRLIIDMFMEVGLESTGVLRIWSGVGDRLYGGNTYVGLGNMISITPINTSAGVQAEEVTVVFAHGGVEGTQDFPRLAMTHDIADNDFRAFLLISRSYSDTPLEIPFFIGRVSNIGIMADRIEMTVYTAMLDATTSKTLARLWTDDQQRLYVNDADRAFRHVTGSSGREIAF